MPPPGAPPAEVLELAGVCVEYVRRAMGLELDYGFETLPILDAYARTVRNGDPMGSHSSRAVELLGLLAPATGSYFGEVARRRFDGRWSMIGSHHADWKLEIEPAPGCVLSFNPLGVARQVISQSDEDGGWQSDYVSPEEYQERMSALLAEMPSVHVRDYYSFSVRFEVLEMLVAHLEATQIESG